MDQRMHARISQLLHEASQPNGNPWRSRQCASEALALINNGSGVPGYSPRAYDGGATRGPLPIPHSVVQMDQVHPPANQSYSEAPNAPSRLLVVPDIPAIAPQTDSPGERLEFSAGGGWLIGWKGIAVDFTAGVFAAGDVEQASVGVRMFLNDGEELITNGTGFDFAPFATIFPRNLAYSPILRRVDVKDNLFVNFRNFQPVGGNTLQPFLTFSFWREKYPGTG